MYNQTEPNLQYNAIVNACKNVPKGMQSMLFRVEGDSYKAHFDNNGKQDFIYISSKKPQEYPGTGRAPSRGLKFHISVDPNKIDEAWTIIMGVMAQHNISKAKFANPNYPQQPGEGREITIYAFKDFLRQIKKTDNQEHTSWEEIISQITTQLALAGIQPGHAAIGNSGGGGDEHLIDNCNYVTWRNDDEELSNTFEHHVAPKNPYEEEQLNKMKEKYFQEKNDMKNLNITCPVEQQNRMSLEEFQKRQMAIKQNYTVNSDNNNNTSPSISSTSESDTKSHHWQKFKYEKKSEKSNFNFSRSNIKKSESSSDKKDKWVAFDYKNRSDFNEKEGPISKISLSGHSRKKNNNNETESFSLEQSDQSTDDSISNRNISTTSSITNITIKLGGTEREKIEFNPSIDIDEDTPLSPTKTEQTSESSSLQNQPTEDKNSLEEQHNTENTQNDKNDRNNTSYGGPSFGFGKNNSN